MIARVRSSLPSGVKLQSHLNSDLGAALPLHISLSRPLVLNTDNKDAFTEQLSRAITELHLAPFRVVPLQLVWVSNWEATRWFLVLKLDRPNGDALNQLLHVTNITAARFGQPKLYDDLGSKPEEKQGSSLDRPKDLSDNFHISIAWSISAPGDHSVSDLDVLAKDTLHIAFDNVKIKVGNGIDSVTLKPGIEQLRGFGHG